MKENLWQICKIIFFAFLVLVLQIAVLKEITTISLNLPLITIICIASFSDLETSLYSSALFIMVISLLSYDSSIYWAYLIIAFITNQLNPKNLEDKFLVAAFYCVLFSPILEILYTPIRENLLNKCIITTLINLATLLPLYFVLKVGLRPKKRNLYS